MALVSLLPVTLLDLSAPLSLYVSVDGIGVYRRERADLGALGQVLGNC